MSGNTSEVTSNSFIFIDPNLKHPSAARNGLLAPLPTPSVADSCTGLVSFTGFALLGCPEPVRKSCAVDLIAQIYIGSPTIDFLPSLYGSLRYFNEDGIIFGYGPSKLYLIQGTVSFLFASHVMVLISCSFLDCSGALEWIQPTVLAAGLRLRRRHSFGLQSFLIIGFSLLILWQVIHLGPAPQDSIEPHIDINRQITLHVSGLVLNLNVDKGTFTVNVNVNVSSYKNAKDGGGVNMLQPPAPFLCIIPSQGKVVMPSNRSVVSVVGTLTDVTLIHGDRHQGIKYFHLTVQCVVSLHSYME